ncbi:hypothetical protein ABPG72_007107 [Tetrahymena utriculariae]
MQNDLDFEGLESEEINKSQQQQQNKIIKIDFKDYLKKLTIKTTPVLLIYQKLDIYDTDYSRLEPCRMLNDKIIDFFVEFLTQLKIFCNLKKNIQNENSKILCSYVFSSLDLYKYNSDVFDLKQPQKYFRLNNQKSILECFDRIYLVVNEANYHWVLIEISLQKADYQENLDIQNEKISNKIQQMQLCESIQSSLKNFTSSNNKSKNQSKNKKQYQPSKQGILEQNELFQPSISSQVQSELQQNNTLSKQSNSYNQLYNLQSHQINLETSKYSKEQCTDLQIDQIRSQKVKRIFMRIYNSLGQKSNIENQTAVILLKKYFLYDFKDLYGQQCLIEFNIISEKVPTQSGGPDCGVFCCKYLQKLFYEENKIFDYSCFTQSKMIEYRRFIQQLMIDIKNSNKDYNKVYEKYIDLQI